MHCTPANPISWLPGLRSEPEGTRKTGSLEKKAVHPGEPDLLAPLAQFSPGRNEEKWFRRERVRRLSGGPNLLVSWTRV